MQQVISALNQGAQLTAKYGTIALQSPFAVPAATVAIALHLGKQQNDSERTWLPSGKLIMSAAMWIAVLSCVKTAGGANPLTPAMAKSVGVHGALFLADGMLVNKMFGPYSRSDENDEATTKWNAAPFVVGLLVAAPWLAMRGYDAFLGGTMPMQALSSKIMNTSPFNTWLAKAPGVVGG